MPTLYPHLQNAFRKCKILKIGSYPYPISPFAGVSQIAPELYDEIIQASDQYEHFSSATLMVSFESAGGQIAATLSQHHRIPYIVARKKQFPLDEEISIGVKTNFDEKTFYLYGNMKGERIILVDDVVASGSTMLATKNSLSADGADVLSFFVVAKKINTIGTSFEDTLASDSTPLQSIVTIQIIDDEMTVRPSQK